MSTRTIASEPDIDRYIAGLSRALLGPQRVKRSLLAEARDGLVDAAAAYQRAGLDAPDARQRAIADFGAVDEVAPSYQAELGAVQSRWTGLAIIAAIGLQIVVWDQPWPWFSPVQASPAPYVEVMDDVIEGLGGACLLAAITLVVGARFAARRPRFGAVMGRVTAGLGWVVGGHLVASAALLHALNPAAGQLSTPALVVPLALFIVLPVAGLIRSSRRCLAFN